MSGLLSQETLKFFGIRDVSFLCVETGISVLAKPLLLKKKSWVCTCSDTVTERGVLTITFIENYVNHAYTVTAKKTDAIPSLTNCYEMTFDFYELPVFLSARIKQYRKLMLRSKRRKEQRFPVGQENWKKFSLKTPNCTLANSKGTSVPCVIINASVHGALVIGTRSLSFHVSDRLLLAAEFTDSKTALPATLVNTESVQDKYWRYSLHFTDPISLSWLSHLNELAMTLEDEEAKCANLNCPHCAHIS